MAIPAIAAVALVFGVWWLSQPAWLLDLPDEAVIRRDSAPKPKGIRLRCDPTELTADAPPGSPERRLEAELYRAIVAASGRLREASQLVVEQVSIPMPRATRFRGWTAAAVALAEQEPSRCSELSIDRFPATALLAPVSKSPVTGTDWRRASTVRVYGSRSRAPVSTKPLARLSCTTSAHVATAARLVNGSGSGARPGRGASPEPSGAGSSRASPNNPEGRLA